MNSHYAATTESPDAEYAEATIESPLPRHAEVENETRHNITTEQRARMKYEMNIYITSLPPPSQLRHENIYCIWLASRAHYQESQVGRL